MQTALIFCLVAVGIYYSIRSLGWILLGIVVKKSVEKAHKEGYITTEGAEK